MFEKHFSLKLKSFNKNLLEKTSRKIKKYIMRNRNDKKVYSYIRLPSKIQKITVLRSPHGNKKSREQFEFITHKRLIKFKYNFSKEPVSLLMTKIQNIVKKGGFSLKIFQEK